MSEISKKEAPEGFKAIGAKDNGTIAGACEGCWFFENTGFYESCEDHGAYCNSEDREDGQDAIFKKLTNPT